MAVVFIGTIVGAGLASGQEITQFFTTYGYKSFLGILICCFIYISIGSLIIKISTNHSLNSYNELLSLVSPGFIGKVTNLLMGIFLISSSSIILAGSGALIHQYFKVSKWVGIIIMLVVSLTVLLRNTKGLIEVNSFIVPSLIIILFTIFILYILFYRDTLSASYIKSIPYSKNSWFLSALLYSGFNILCCSGVLVPLSKEIKNIKALTIGATIGSLVLTALCCMINLLLLLNVPYIFQYEIPLLYISNRFGKIIQIMLLCIIWLEMFSTEISDIYSIAKSLQSSFKFSYNKSIFIVLLIALPISQIGFVNLIKYLYPAFGFISLIFMIQCLYFYKKTK